MLAPVEGLALAGVASVSMGTAACLFAVAVDAHVGDAQCGDARA